MNDDSSTLKNISHTDAYDMCMILQNVSPYPKEFYVSFVPSAGVLGLLLVSASVLAPVFIGEASFVPTVARVLFIIGVISLIACLHPTWGPLVSMQWRRLKDSLITEYRTKKMRQRYWRNFYDS